MGKTKSVGKTKTKEGDVVEWFDPADLTLRTDPDDPYYDPRVNLPISEELIANILQDGQGVLQPINVCKDGKDIVVIAGKQRTKAVTEINRRRADTGEAPLLVPAIIRRGSPLELLGVMISENNHRQNDEMLINADRLKRYLNAGGTKKAACALWGVTMPTVDRWERLIGIDPELKQAVVEGEVSATTAAKIAENPIQKQKEIVKEVKAKKGKRNRNKVAEENKAPKKERLRTRKYKEIKKYLDEIVKKEGVYNPEYHPAEEIIGNVLLWCLNEIEEQPYPAMEREDRETEEEEDDFDPSQFEDDEDFAE